MLTFYRLLTDSLAWPIWLWLRLRAWRGKEDGSRLSERRGLSSLSRPAGQVVWCHAASVGESLTLLPLIERLTAQARVQVLITTGTVSSAQVMADRLPPNVIHQFAPWDRRPWVNRFLDHWQPALAVRMESEIWPNTLLAAKERNIPTTVINGRLSERSFKRWARFSHTANRLFSELDLAVCQTEVFAGYFGKLGVDDVRIAPNLKLSAAPLPTQDAEVKKVQNNIGERPVWLAASTHMEEERLVIETHNALAEEIETVLTVVVPRHPERGTYFKQRVTARGFCASLRSAEESLNSKTDVYIADTFAELGLFYRVAPVVFMGKSIDAVGGQNPIEPTHFDCAILFGPHMENFEDIARTMVEGNMAIQVTDGAALQNTIKTLLMDENRRTSLSQAAKSLNRLGENGLETTFNALTELLTKSKVNGFRS